MTNRSNTNNLAGSGPELRSILCVAAAVWLLLDLWRVWTPALITVFGQAAATPPELIGAFALGCMGLPLVLLAVGRRLWLRPGVMVGILALAGLARLVLGFAPGGQTMLYIAAVGVVLAVLWLCLATARFGAVLLPGLFCGLALATTWHAALGSFGAVWRSDVWGWLELIMLLGLIGATVTSSEKLDAAPVARRMAWLVFPALLLAGIVLANVGRASAAHEVIGPLFAVVGCWLALGVLGAQDGLTRRLPATWLVRSAAVLLVVVTAALFLPFGEHQLLTPWVAPLLLLGMPALVLTLVGAAGPSARTNPQSHGTRPALAAAGGAVIWVLILFAYYAGYDLGYTAHWLVLLLAVAIAVTAAARVARPVDGLPAPPRFLAATVVAGITAAVLAVVGPWVTLGSLGQSEPAATESTPLNVMAYNLRMGFGTDGRFDAVEVAQLIRDRGADVVLLSEIDRGWLLNGGQDQLRVLARLTGMEAVFGPAADPVWGDAILTSLPVSEVSRHQFSSYGALTGAQALSATLDWRGEPVRAIVTHLQPVNNETDRTIGQARELAQLMERAADRHEHVVMGGDLNTTPGSEPWSVLTGTRFVDALANARPLLTAPTEEPTEELDHLLITPSLRPVSASAIEVPYSDHLPVEVLLNPAM